MSTRPLKGPAQSFESALIIEGRLARRIVVIRYGSEHTAGGSIPNRVESVHDHWGCQLTALHYLHRPKGLDRCSELSATARDMTKYFTANGRAPGRTQTPASSLGQARHRGINRPKPPWPPVLLTQAARGHVPASTAPARDCGERILPFDPLPPPDPLPATGRRWNGA